MTKMRKLINEAKESATFRGHKLSRFTIKGTHKAYAECACGASVVVLPRPFYNETEVSGEAVAVNCTHSIFRVWRAGQAIEGYAKGHLDGDDIETKVSYLLADLMHFCSVTNDVEWYSAIDKAERHFLEEAEERGRS